MANATNQETLEVTIKVSPKDARAALAAYVLAKLNSDESILDHLLRDKTMLSKAMSYKTSKELQKSPEEGAERRAYLKKEEKRALISKVLELVKGSAKSADEIQTTLGMTKDVWQKIQPEIKLTPGVTIGGANANRTYKYAEPKAGAMKASGTKKSETQG